MRGASERGRREAGERMKRREEGERRMVGMDPQPEKRHKKRGNKQQTV